MTVSLNVPATMKVRAEVLEMSWNSAHTMANASTAPNTMMPMETAVWPGLSK